MRHEISAGFIPAFATIFEQKHKFLSQFYNHIEPIVKYNNTTTGKAISHLTKLKKKKTTKNKHM